jgi:hypothetical protein
MSHINLMNKSAFTHRASFYGIPCYFNEHTGDLRARWHLEWLLPVATAFHNYLIAPFDDRGFPIRLKGEL